MSDGGWLYVKRLFAPRHVVSLAVPGTSPDGFQDIEVGFDDGSEVSVTSETLSGAWTKLAAAAESLRAAPAGPRSRDVPQDDQIPTPEPVPILAREGQEGDQGSSVARADMTPPSGASDGQRKSEGGQP